MNRQDAFAWARGMGVSSTTSPAEKRLIAALLNQDDEAIEEMFISAGQKGANADTNHPLRSVWEIARAYING